MKDSREAHQRAQSLVEKARLAAQAKPEPELLVRTESLASKAQARYVKAVHDQINALIALEKVTAGGVVPCSRTADTGGGVMHRLVLSILFVATATTPAPAADPGELRIGMLSGMFRDQQPKVVQALAKPFRDLMTKNIGYSGRRGGHGRSSRPLR